ncbi:MAG: hypothetical protein QM736_00440 [Vicinamibacterales bacterium]
MNRTFITGILAAATLVAAPTVRAQDVSGRWDATINVGGADIPFRLDVWQEGSTLHGTLYNGDDLETTTAGRVKDGTVTLEWEHYLTNIVASQKGSELVGRVEMRNDS